MSALPSAGGFDRVGAAERGFPRKQISLKLSPVTIEELPLEMSVQVEQQLEPIERSSEPIQDLELDPSVPISVLDKQLLSMRADHLDKLLQWTLERPRQMDQVQAVLCALHRRDHIVLGRAPNLCNQLEDVSHGLIASRAS
jgi:hypothetical protein